MNETYATQEVMNKFSKNYVGGADTKPSTPIDDVHRTLGDVRALCSRIQALADRVCGSVPEACEACGGEPPFGVLPQLSHACGEANRQMSNAREALQSLERSFP